MELPAEDGAEAPPEGSPEAEVPEGPQRPAGQWSGAEVGSWLAAHGGAAALVLEHGLTGRALLRLTEGSLRRMGIAPRSRRRELLRELLRLRLRQELQELRSIASGERQELRSIAAGEHPPGRGRSCRSCGASPPSEDDVPMEVPEPVGAEEMPCEDKAAGTEQHMQEQCWRRSL